MSNSGGQFPAEDVFKYFVCPMTYDDRVMNISREAYLQRLIGQGFIKDEHDQSMQRSEPLQISWSGCMVDSSPTATSAFTLSNRAPRPQKPPHSVGLFKLLRSSRRECTVCAGSRTCQGRSNSRESPRKYGPNTR
jgi:hypothetical protein